MEDHRARGQRRMRQVREQLAQVAGQDHTLVPEQARGQADDVVVRQRGQGLLAAAPRQVERPLERVEVLVRGLDEHLLDARHGALRQCAAGGEVDRHLAPAGDAHAFALQLRGKRFAAPPGLGVGVWQEHHAGRDGARVQCDAALVGQRAHEAVGAVDQHAATVARQAVGGDAAAMGHARERLERDVDDRALGRALDLGDQAEATAVVLACGVVEAPIRVCPHRRVVVVGWTGGVGPVPEDGYAETTPAARHGIE